MNTFGERLKELLKEHNMSQKVLSKRLNLQPSTINKWCVNKNQPSLDTLIEISKVLNEPIDILLTDEIFESKIYGTDTRDFDNNLVKLLVTDFNKLNEFNKKFLLDTLKNLLDTQNLNDTHR